MTTETLIKNGKAAAAALLAGGIGALTMGLMTTLGESVAAIGTALNWYSPVGPLAGKTTMAVIVWLIAWAILGNQWKDKDVDFDKIAMIALVLLLLGILGTFPPFFELFVPKA
ncbi:MAG: hypothetical protein Fur0035_12370 [Anaerolineales bacterium]